MSTSKPTAPPRRQPQTLESLVLRALGGAAPAADPATPSGAAARTKPRAGRAEGAHGPAKATYGKGSLPATVVVAREDGAGAPSELVAHARRLRQLLQACGMLHSETVRVRTRDLGDRRLVVEFAPDPEDAGALLVRIRPASPTPLPEPPARLLSTQQAAELLNVSRPYVAQLVDEGRFAGVVRTRSNHRRIPVAEVERMREEMREVRRAALDEMAALGQEQRRRELEAARAKSRWTKKPGA